MIDLAPLARELAPVVRFCRQKRAYVLTGSIVMQLHGLPREPDDIDMFVRPEVYDRLKSRGWDELWPREGDPPMLEWELPSGHQVHAWFEWDARWPGDPIAEAFATATIVRGWPCMSIWQLRQWKTVVGRPKDLDDIALIDGGVCAAAVLEPEAVQLSSLRDATP